MRTFVTLSLCLAACQGSDDFASATPETSAMTMELTSNTTTSSSSQAEYLGHTEAGLRDLNAAVAAVVQPVEQAVAAGAHSITAGTQTFGPTDRGAATFMLTVTKIADAKFAWKLDGKPLGADDSAYVTVMTGAIAVGETAHRGVGVMGADLDKLASIDSDFHGSGQMLVGFAHIAGYKVLAYGLKNFSLDVSVRDGIDAVFSGWKGPLGVAHVRMAIYDNIVDSPTPAKELVLAHARWLPGIGGRADARVMAGDVPAGQMIVVNSCWDRDGADVDGFLLVRECPLALVASGCTVLRTAGALGNCAADLSDEQLPPTSATDATLEAGAPQNPALPASMP
jgi:hypothetical protein